MQRGVVLMFFIVLYLYNVAVLVSLIPMKSFFNSRRPVFTKIVNIYFFFVFAGLPIMSLFFFKIRTVVTLFNNRNIPVLVLFILLFFISLFVYNRLFKNFLKTYDFLFVNSKLLSEEEPTSKERVLVYFLLSSSFFLNLFFVSLLFQLI